MRSTIRVDYLRDLRGDPAYPSQAQLLVVLQQIGGLNLWYACWFWCWLTATCNSSSVRCQFNARIQCALDHEGQSRANYGVCCMLERLEIHSDTMIGEQKASQSKGMRSILSEMTAVPQHGSKHTCRRASNGFRLLWPVIRCQPTCKENSLLIISARQ